MQRFVSCPCVSNKHSPPVKKRCQPGRRNSPARESPSAPASMVAGMPAGMSRLICPQHARCDACWYVAQYPLTCSDSSIAPDAAAADMSANMPSDMLANMPPDMLVTMPAAMSTNMSASMLTAIPTGVSPNVPATRSRHTLQT